MGKQQECDTCQQPEQDCRLDRPDGIAVPGNRQGYGGDNVKCHFQPERPDIGHEFEFLTEPARVEARHEAEQTGQQPRRRQRRTGERVIPKLQMPALEQRGVHHDGDRERREVRRKQAKHAISEESTSTILVKCRECLSDDEAADDEECGDRDRRRSRHGRTGSVAPPAADAENVAPPPSAPARTDKRRAADRWWPQISCGAEN